MACAPHSTARLHKGVSLCRVEAWTPKETFKPSLGTNLKRASKVGRFN
jgi:hypothetical protein